MHSCSSEKDWRRKDSISEALKELCGTQETLKEIGTSFVIDHFAGGWCTNLLQP